MAVVSILVDGKKYNLSCDDGQEECLEKFGNILDKKAGMLRKAFPLVTDNMLLVMLGVLLIEEADIAKRDKINAGESQIANPKMAEKLENILKRIDELAKSL